MSTLKTVKENLIQSVIASVLAVISEKGLKPVEELKIDGSPVEYAGDVGMFISALIELHDIFELNFEMNLNEVGTKFPTIESLVEYFMIRIVDEKI
ncbi:hypothetical protein [Bacillus cereus]|uniref:hypothetical protein n=1 Tax=Bacillus cereus TaxID=1396 RepID=UPI002570F4D3|nr:hypothetical protein [Bacillus cereus]MDM5461245.1 hypothetical protein [Bacillus cereus]WJE26899.1 hypothetical protein QRE65_08420 [Bacillus cereus]